MPIDLEALAVFARVAELASFTQAAEQLGIPKARVSTSVQHLEAALGTRLLHRTTRSVRPTPDGELFYERCKELLADVDDLQTLFQHTPTALRGRLRVDMPTGLARNQVIPQLGAFLKQHPQLEIELSTTDRQVDLVHEGFDCVVRIGALQDSGLVARRLGVVRMVNLASPAYLAEHGTPVTLDDLDRHQLVHYATTLGSKPLGFEYPDGERWRFKPMRGAVTVNNAEAYYHACLAGLGLIQVPVTVERSALVEVLPQFVAAPMPVSLLYAHRRGLSKRLQALMNWLAQVIEPHLDPP